MPGVPIISSNNNLGSQNLEINSSFEIGEKAKTNGTASLNVNIIGGGKIQRIKDQKSKVIDGRHQSFDDTVVMLEGEFGTEQKNPRAGNMSNRVETEHKKSNVGVGNDLKALN